MNDLNFDLIFQAYFVQLLLMVVGLFLELIVIVSRDEPPQPTTVQEEKAEQAQSQVKGEGKADAGAQPRQEMIKIGPLEFPPPYFPRALRRGLMISGFVLLAVGLVWMIVAGIWFPMPPFVPTPTNAPTSVSTLTPTLTSEARTVFSSTASLVSLRYEVDSFDPRLVDLRTASTSGIPASEGRTLQFLDLWVSVPEYDPELAVQAEIYANDRLIGHTDAMPFIAGIHLWEQVTIDSFSYGSNPDAWLVQPDWTDLQIVLVTYHGDDVVGSSYTLIHLDAGGTAWLLDPPNVSFSSIVYSINDGPPLVLDMRSRDDCGLGIQPGDTLTLLEIWYHANYADTSDQNTVQIEAYLTTSGFDAGTYQATSPNVIQRGVHIIDFASLNWTVPDDKDYLVLSLARDDGVVMDRLVWPLASQETAGLVSSAESILWPFDQVEYVDFESPNDLDEWLGVASTTVAQSNVQAFSGDCALAITTPGTSEEELAFVNWMHPFQAEVVIGQVYWPSQGDIWPAWAQVCVFNTPACVPISRELDRWNTFVMDLSKLTIEDLALNQTELPGLVLQGHIQEADQENPYTFYIDSIQVYPIHQP